MGAIHLVRHGQASFGSGDYDRLSETGHLQARLTGEDMAARGLRPDVLVHGGLRRQRETAEGILTGLREQAGWDCPLELDEGWAEYDADAVLEAAREAGLSSEQGTLDTAGSSAEAKQAFQRELDAALGHWAGLQAFAEYQRTTSAALEAAAARSGSGRTTVVVSSAGTISLAVAGLLADRGPALFTTRRSIPVAVPAACVVDVVVHVAPEPEADGPALEPRGADGPRCCVDQVPTGGSRLHLGSSPPRAARRPPPGAAVRARTVDSRPAGPGTARALRRCGGRERRWRAGGRTSCATGSSARG